MKNLITILIIIASASLYAQNTGNIKGIIKTSDLQPAEFVNVSIEGTSFGSATNRNGEFEIRNIAAGNYRLIITYVGHETKVIDASIRADETILIPEIVINETAKEMQEVLVQDDKINRFSDKESEYVARLPIRDIENPQSYSAVNHDLIMEQSITDFSSAINSIPGITSSTVSPQGLTAISFRGFLTNTFIRNGMYIITTTGGDPQTVERIEAIKGPSGALFGTYGVAYGGLINKVTKKPFAGNLVEGGITLGSYSLNRITADINTPLNKDKSALLRVNTAYHTEQSFQDFGYKRYFFLAPSVYYKFSDDFDMLLEAEVNISESPSTYFFTGAPALGVSRIDQIRTDYFKSYSSKSLTHEPGRLNNYYGQLNYKFSSDWKLSVNFTLGDSRLTGGNIIPIFGIDSSITRRVYDYDLQLNTLDIQPNLSGEFYLGNVRNRMVIGFDFQDVRADQTGAFNFAADKFNYYKEAVPVLNANTVRANYALFINTSEKRKTYGIYISDVITLMPQLNLMLSLRYDYDDYLGNKNIISGMYTTNPYNQSAVSPTIGATYELIKDELSLFANYMNGFNNVPTNLLGQSFKPEFAIQSEGGIKLRLFDNMISSTLSYYNIAVTNRVRVDPANPLGSLQDGKQISKGIDFELAINPCPGFNLIGGYSYNDSKYTKADATVEGKRPLGTPANTANLWTSYEIQSGTLRGAGAGIGFVYSDELYFDDLNTLLIPSYTVVRGSLFYSFPGFRVALTAENLTNEKYWDFLGSPQMTRRVTGSILFRF